jgi:hypothetical protein
VWEECRLLSRNTLEKNNKENFPERIPEAGPNCVTASVTVAKQGEFKELESKKNLEGWPKWEILVSDQTTKITEVNLVSIAATREHVHSLWELYQEVHKMRRGEIPGDSDKAEINQRTDHVSHAQLLIN